MASENWDMYVEDNALVVEFHEQMTADGNEFAKANKEFERLASQSNVDTHISILNMEDAMSSDVFEAGQQAAQVGAEHGITTWVVVSEDIKAMAVKSQIEEVPEVEGKAAESKEEAFELAGVE